jgi:hypothetical protein
MGQNRPIRDWDRTDHIDWDRTVQSETGTEQTNKRLGQNLPIRDWERTDQ